MSVRVTDPSGMEWAVSREWFRLPAWARWRSRRVPDSAAVEGDETIAIIAALLTLLVLVLVFTVVLPLALLLVGVLVTAIALLVRLTNLGVWTVRAVSADRALEWRVRGVLRSRRALHTVARALERGGEAALKDDRPAVGAQPVA